MSFLVPYIFQMMKFRFFLSFVFVLPPPPFTLYSTTDEELCIIITLRLKVSWFLTCSCTCEHFRSMEAEYLAKFVYIIYIYIFLFVFITTVYLFIYLSLLATFLFINVYFLTVFVYACIIFNLFWACRFLLSRILW